MGESAGTASGGRPAGCPGGRGVPRARLARGGAAAPARPRPGRNRRPRPVRRRRVRRALPAAGRRHRPPRPPCLLRPPASGHARAGETPARPEAVPSSCRRNAPAVPPPSSAPDPPPSTSLRPPRDVSANTAPHPLEGEPPMKQSILAAAAGAALALASLAACGDSGSDSGSGSGRTRSRSGSRRSAPRAAGAPPTPSRSGEAAAAGIDLKFSDAQQKQENQIQAIRSYIAQKVDVIAFSPVVETGWDTVLKEAKAAKIPVDPHRPRGRLRRTRRST